MKSSSELSVSCAEILIVIRKNKAMKQSSPLRIREQLIFKYGVCFAGQNSNYYAPSDINVKNLGNVFSRMHYDSVFAIYENSGNFIRWKCDMIYLY
jgi:hypothetical protein